MWTSHSIWGNSQGLCITGKKGNKSKVRPGASETFRSSSGLRTTALRLRVPPWERGAKALYRHFAITSNSYVQRWRNLLSDRAQMPPERRCASVNLRSAGSFRPTHNGPFCAVPLWERGAVGTIALSRQNRKHGGRAEGAGASLGHHRLQVWPGHGYPRRSQ